MTFLFICLVGVVAFILISINISSDKINNADEPTPQNHSYKILQPLEVVKYLSITFLILAATYVVITYFSPCLSIYVYYLYIISINISSDKIKNADEPTPQNHSYKILQPLEVVKYLSITFLILAANYVVITYMSPLLSIYGYDLNIVSLVLLVAGIGAILGTSLGGYITDAIGSKNWLIISLSTYTVLMFIFQSFLPILIITLIGVFVWNIVQWGSNPPVQIGIISQIEGDTSAAMSWNMSSLNAGIGAGSLLGGIFVTYF